MHVHFADDKTSPKAPPIHRRASTAASGGPLELDRIRRSHAHSASVPVFVATVAPPSSKPSAFDQLQVPASSGRAASGSDARIRQRYLSPHDPADLPIRPGSAESRSVADRRARSPSSSSSSYRRSPPDPLVLRAPSDAPRASSLAPPPSRPRTLSASSGGTIAGAGQSPTVLERVRLRRAEEVLYEALDACECPLDDKIRLLRQVALQVQDKLTADHSPRRATPGLHPPLTPVSPTSTSTLAASVSHHRPLHAASHPHGHHAALGHPSGSVRHHEATSAPLNAAAWAAHEAGKAKKLASQQVHRVMHDREAAC